MPTSDRSSTGTRRSGTGRSLRRCSIAASAAWNSATTTPARTRGIELVMPIAFDAAMLDVAAAVDHVSDTGPVAVIGYCFGGSVAWIAACDLPIAAAVGYYGGQVFGMKDRTPTAPTMLHFGELDAGIPLDQVQAIADAHPDVPVHVYEGADHGFNCDARPQHDARSAAIALGRTLEFLADHGVTP